MFASLLKTNKQTTQQTNKHPNKQTNKQTHKQTLKRTLKQTNKNKSWRFMHSKQATDRMVIGKHVLLRMATVFSKREFPCKGLASILEV